MEVEVDNAAAHVTSRTGGWPDKVLPVSALFVSFLSILLAWGNGEAMQDLVRQNERLVQANSQPHLRVRSMESVGQPGQQDIRFRVTNGGVGPAEIKTIEMLIDGQPVESSRDLLRQCCGLETREYYREPMLNAMLRPGESIDFFRIVTRPETAAGLPRLTDALDSKRIVARFCYCSVFSDCWIRTSQENLPPQPVGKQCPVPKLAYSS